MGVENRSEQPPTELILERSENGVLGTTFSDINERECSLVASSAEGEAIRLGVQTNHDGTNMEKMHLNRDQVAALLPHLTRFVETGSLE